ATAGAPARRPRAAGAGAGRRGRGGGARVGQRAGAHVAPVTVVEPELSVVVPTRDRAGVLVRCLGALAAQQVDAAFEVVVADDGSTDETPRVLASRGHAEAVRIPPSGRSAARNAALRRASGRLVLFVDDDVLATAGLLQRHLDHHRAH